MRKIIMVDGINPEPWTSPDLGTKRVGTKIIPTSTKKALLREYQLALKDTITEAYFETITSFPADQPLELLFYFWRKLDVYTLANDRTSTRHRADATNIQKATEDALQKILFPNDVQIQHVSSEIMAQGREVEPRILIICQPYIGRNRGYVECYVEQLERNLDRPFPPGNVLYLEDETVGFAP